MNYQGQAHSHIAIFSTLGSHEPWMITDLKDALAEMRLGGERRAGNPIIANKAHSEQRRRRRLMYGCCGQSSGNTDTAHHQTASVGRRHQMSAYDVTRQESTAATGNTVVEHTGYCLFLLCFCLISSHFGRWCDCNADSLHLLHSSIRSGHRDECWPKRKL